MHSTNTIQTTNEKKSNHRARWAAFGAAVAVSLGAGSIGLVSATAPEGAAAYQAINPCRLADTRPDSNVGPYAAPLGADQIYTFDGWGDVPGVCDLPTGTTALQLNVTAVNATQLTNLRFFPTGSEVPTASNLNPAPNQPPTPNAVTVTLNSEGKFDVFNRFGSVDLVIDVAGVYTDHQHDGDDIIDGSLTGDDIADHSLSVIDIANETGLVTTYEEGPVAPLAGNALLILGAEMTPIIADAIRVPSNGYLDIEVTGTFTPNNDPGLNGATCQLGLNQAAIDYDAITFRVNEIGDGTSTAPVSFNAHRTVRISADDNPQLITQGQQVELLCQAYGTIVPLPGTNLSGQFSDLQLTATFVPTTYNPVVFQLPPVINPLPPVIVNP